MENETRMEIMSEKHELVDLKTKKNSEVKISSQESEITRLNRDPSIIGDQPTFSTILHEIKVKDGGYGWIIVGAMFTVNVLSTGYVKGFGIIYNAIEDYFPNTSGVMSGVMIGLLVGCKTMFAPVVDVLSKVIGIRTTMCIGCIFYTMALFVSYFCTSSAQLAFTLGAMAGFGQCIIDSLQVVVLAHFFDTKISIANGIRVSGTPCGGLLFPFLFAALLDAYGLKLMFIILSGIMLHIYICSFLTRPLETHVKIKAIEYINAHSDYFDAHANASNNVEQKVTISPSNVTEMSLKRELYHRILDQNLASNRKKKKPFDFSPLKKPAFYFFLTMASMYPLAMPLVSYYATIYAKTVLGLSPYQISLVLGLQAFFDCILRITIGWLNSKGLYKLTHGFFICMLCSGVGSALTPLSRGPWSLLATLCLHSLGPASFHTFINVILGHKFGSKSIGTTWGYLRMIQGVFGFLHPALIGHIVDWTGSYTLPFLIMGSGPVVCGSMILLQDLIFPVPSNSGKC